MDDSDQALFPCFSAELVATALKDTPVVMVTGQRQCGKTTLVRDLVAVDVRPLLGCESCGTPSIWFRPIHSMIKWAKAAFGESRHR
jgi:hypothetical protein